MRHTPLPSTSLDVSPLAFGCGPISSLMTGEDEGRQLEVVRRALEAGINWFDTAATYGDGESERSLGRALRELGAGGVHVATKVRLFADDLGDIRGSVRASVRGSLERLGLARITLLQLHNAITGRRGEEPASVTPADVLEAGGVLEAFEELRAEGVVEHVGLTALGQPGPLRAVVRSQRFAAIQVPYSLVNPSAGQPVPADFGEADYGNVIGECRRLGMGVFAIRVFGGGVLAGSGPSPYTYQTKYFPLDLFHRDQQRAARLRDLLGDEYSLKEAAVRFSLSHLGVQSLIIGFGEPSHVDEAVAFVEKGPLPDLLLDELRRLEYHSI